MKRKVIIPAVLLLALSINPSASAAFLMPAEPDGNSGGPVIEAVYPVLKGGKIYFPEELTAKAEAQLFNVENNKNEVPEPAGGGGSSEPDKRITMEEAKDIALKSVSLFHADGSRVSYVGLSEYNGTAAYYIEASMEDFAAYEIYVRASDGVILKCDSLVIAYNKYEHRRSYYENLEDAADSMDMERAMEIALEKTGLSGENFVCRKAELISDRDTRRFDNYLLMKSEKSKGRYTMIYRIEFKKEEDDKITYYLVSLSLPGENIQ